MRSVWPLGSVSDGSVLCVAVCEEWREGEITELFGDATCVSDVP
jgi:hypothetical protein